MLGIKFEHHRHGNGPMHYSADLEELVLEIYPLNKSQEQPNNNLRLGFQVDFPINYLKKLSESSWTILTEPTQTDWGIMAIIQDMDGRKVELTFNS